MGVCAATLLAGCCSSGHQRAESTDVNEPAGAETTVKTNTVPMVIPRDNYQRPYPGYPTLPENDDGRQGY